MYTGKGIQLKTNILQAIHFVLAWQQVTWSTILNCSEKCDHVKKNEEGSDLMETDKMVTMMARKMIGLGWGQAPGARDMWCVVCGTHLW
jgi:hypothetical protein